MDCTQDLNLGTTAESGQSTLKAIAEKLDGAGGLKLLNWAPLCPRIKWVNVIQSNNQLTVIG